MPNAHDKMNSMQLPLRKEKRFMRLLVLLQENYHWSSETSCYLKPQYKGLD